MRLFIIGLRRSGTTIFWESFRGDRRLVCYDEPFNRLLAELPAPEPKGTRDEWIALYNRDPQRFRRLFSPIPRGEELTDGLTAAQEAYLEFVLGSAERVVIDVTRCHFKLAALKRIAPEAHVVHLYRRAAAWVGSHLLPRRHGLVGGLRSLAERRTFFTRRRWYDGWGMETLIGSSRDSAFGRRLVEAGLDPAQVYAMPAAGRLLAYWKVHYDRVEEDGRKMFAERFSSLAFEDFCRAPADALDSLYERMGMEAPLLNLGNVHPARGAYAPADPRWRRLAEVAGLAREMRLVL